MDKTAINQHKAMAMGKSIPQGKTSACNYGKAGGKVSKGDKRDGAGKKDK